MPSWGTSVIRTIRDWRLARRIEALMIPAALEWADAEIERLERRYGA